MTALDAAALSLFFIVVILFAIWDWKASGIIFLSMVGAGLILMGLTSLFVYLGLPLPGAP